MVGIMMPMMMNNHAHNPCSGCCHYKRTSSSRRDWINKEDEDKVSVLSSIIIDYIITHRPHNSFSSHDIFVVFFGFEKEFVLLYFAIDDALAMLVKEGVLE